MKTIIVALVVMFGVGVVGQFVVFGIAAAAISNASSTIEDSYYDGDYADEDDDIEYDEDGEVVKDYNEGADEAK